MPFRFLIILAGLMSATVWLYLTGPLENYVWWSVKSPVSAGEYVKPARMVLCGATVLTGFAIYSLVGLQPVRAIAISIPLVSILSVSLSLARFFGLHLGFELGLNFIVVFSIIMILLKPSAAWCATHFITKSNSQPRLDQLSHSFLLAMCCLIACDGLIYLLHPAFDLVSK